MNPSHSKSQVFFPNLDTLRFFCFLSVFFFHSFATKYDEVLSHTTYSFIKRVLFGNGNLGVNFFFVLSGFLITYLLIVEKANYGRIDIKKFYMRRLLRIWPLFYFCVFFGFIVFPYLKSFFGGTPSETAMPIYYFFFINNFDFIRNGLPDASVLGVLWSVAIEEQFYLFWPLLVGLTRTKYLPYVFVGIIISSWLFRFSNAERVIVLEHHTLSCISDMTVGGLGAYLVFYSQRFKAKIESMKPLWIGCIYLLSLTIFLFRKEIFNHNSLLLAVDRLVISILFLLIILEQNYSKASLFKLHKLKRISRLGQYTYGLYCLHMIGILVIATLLTKLGWNKSVWQVLVVEGGLSLALTILLALFSYHFFEKKFLRLKDRFAVIKTKPIVVEEKQNKDNVLV